MIVNKYLKVNKCEVNKCIWEFKSNYSHPLKAVLTGSIQSVKPPNNSDIVDVLLVTEYDCSLQRSSRTSTVISSNEAEIGSSWERDLVVCRWLSGVLFVSGIITHMFCYYWLNCKSEYSLIRVYFTVLAAVSFSVVFFRPFLFFRPFWIQFLYFDIRFHFNFLALMMMWLRWKLGYQIFHIWCSHLILS